MAGPSRVGRPRLFLSGGNGMVGRNLLDHPGIADWEVAAPARAELDLTDRARVRRFMSDFRPDVVVHAAGRVGGIQANIAAPVDFLVDNVDVGLNVVLGARDAGVTTLINLGSSCMYPRAAENPLREDMILTGGLEPTNEGYALAKIMTARLCDYITRMTPELRYVTFIPCNLYGLYDKFDPAHSHLVPAIIRKLHDAKARGDSQIDIWGDGTARREFMYAGDLADAIVRAIATPGDLPVIMNIGPGQDHSINDYYRLAADIIGWKGNFVHDLSRPVGMSQKLVDTSRQDGWGWRPTVSLQEGLRKTYAFFLKEVAA